MQIGFRDAKLQRLFNDHQSLQAKFGPALASRIASRMGLLKAAPRLSLVPGQPPILLALANGDLAEFTVNLSPEKKLRFRASNPAVRKGALLDLEAVTEIEVSGVEESQHES